MPTPHEQTALEDANRRMTQLNVAAGSRLPIQEQLRRLPFKHWAGALEFAPSVTRSGTPIKTTLRRVVNHRLVRLAERSRE